MKCLLDTHAFIWLSTDDERLSGKARNAILDIRTSLFLSSASIWEMVIKTALGKLKLPDHPETFIRKQLVLAQIHELPVTFKHAFSLQQLPTYHKDPFDRILICQAIAGGMTILTPDTRISSYPVQVEW